MLDYTGLNMMRVIQCLKLKKFSQKHSEQLLASYQIYDVML